MLKQLFMLGLFTVFASSVKAQSGCGLTITKSSSGLTRTYTANSTISGAAYTIESLSLSDWFSETSSTNTLTIPANFGTYVIVSAVMTSPTCSDTLTIWDTLTGPIHCPSVSIPQIGVYKFWYRQYPNEIPNQLKFLQNYSAPYYAPDYTRTIKYDYGDGTTGTEDFHNYSSPQNNTIVKLTHTFTHPTFPSCTISNTTAINIDRCSNAQNDVRFDPLPNGDYKFINSFATTLSGDYEHVNRWYTISPMGQETYQATGDSFDYAFPNGFDYKIVATTSWFERKPTGSNFVCISVDTFQLVNVPSGLPKTNNTIFSVAPNPANNTLKIQVGQPAGKVTATLSSITGQVVMQEVITGTNATLFVSQLPAGTYLLQLQSGTEIHTEKVQIQH